MKKNTLAFSTAAIVIILLGAGYLVDYRAQPPAPTSAVDRLLSQSMPDTSGQAQHLAQWKNKALVVNFWATWCAPCVQEMPALSSLQAEISPANIQIIGIGIDSAANIAKFAEKYKIAYPLYTAGMNATNLTHDFGDKEGGLPFTVLIGRNGQVKKTYLGRLKVDELRKDLAAL